MSLDFVQQGIQADAGRLPQSGAASKDAKLVDPKSQGLVAYWPFDEVPSPPHIGLCYFLSSRIGCGAWHHLPLFIRWSTDVFTATLLLHSASAAAHNRGNDVARYAACNGRI